MTSMSRVPQPIPVPHGPTVARSRPAPLDVRAFLQAAGITVGVLRLARGAVLFTQGSTAAEVWCIQEGGVMLAVLSPAGKEAVVGILGPGDFVGDGCLAGQPLRMGTARAVAPTTVLAIPKLVMLKALHEHSPLATHVLSHLLDRNRRLEEDLVDQLFNSSEKRLARTLLRLARFGEKDTSQRAPTLSQETLADMVGTTRSRVNVFMNKFRRLGFIDYQHNGRLTVHSALMSVVVPTEHARASGSR